MEKAWLIVFGLLFAGGALPCIWLGVRGLFEERWDHWRDSALCVFIGLSAAFVAWRCFNAALGA